MQYTTLGRTGITISKLCLGCMGFGKAGKRDLYGSILQQLRCFLGFMAARCDAPS